MICSITPLRRLAGEREGPAPLAWEGEVPLAAFGRTASTHLAPTLSPRQRAERERRRGLVSDGRER